MSAIFFATRFILIPVDARNGYFVFQVDVASVGFEYAGPVKGTNFAAYGYMIPMATSKNAFETSLSLTYPSKALMDLRAKVVMTER